MRRNGLTHREAALILGVSERTSKQYAAGMHSTTKKPLEIPEPIRKLMRAKDMGIVLDPLPLGGEPESRGRVTPLLTVVSQFEIQPEDGKDAAAVSLGRKGGKARWAKNGS